MKTNSFRFLALIFSASLLFASCSSDDDKTEDEKIENTPSVVQADGQWKVDSILNTSNVKWYKVTGSDEFNSMKIEWSELGYHGNNKDYSADIQVSAYKLDGITPYKVGESNFEDMNVGYEAEAKDIILNEENDILLKVALTSENIFGTYALKVSGSAEADTIIKNINIKDEWKEFSINEKEVFAFEIDATNYDTLQIIWAEVGSPENTGDISYTADIQGSVYMSDGLTAYEQLDNPGKLFEDKDKSWSDNPKGIVVDESDKIVKIFLRKNAAVGTFALKVVGRGNNGSNPADEIVYTEIGLLNEWLVDTIAAGETIGYKVKHGLTEATTLEIIWSEVGAPENTYTAEIEGSVYKKDAETPYLIDGSDKEFVDKNKSWSDDPKAIIIDPLENNFRIHIKETAGMQGSYALKIVEKVK
ncbi:MAG: hypothetical protein JEZ09_14605 [Salinivirgaceae bacterium]|nr:hypothetical protein [Salinivirgaceae bacterium]